MRISSKLALLLVIVLMFSCMAVEAAAQTSAQAASVAGAALAPAAISGTQPAEKPMTFDVVSIKLNKSGGFRGGEIFPDDGDSMSLVDWTLEEMIKFDYGIHREPGLEGLPAWASKDRYDVEAKVAESDVAAWRKLSGSGRRLVLRTLLADSFQLKMHTEDRELPIYSLVIAKNGPKNMKEIKPADLDKDLSRGADGTPLGGWVWHRGSKPGDPFIAHQMSMGYFLFWLNTLGLGRPIYNHTGLTANYDFTLQFVSMQGTTSPDAAIETDTAGGPSIFTALQDQLGLKLEAAKGPVTVRVVDHVERPSAN